MITVMGATGHTGGGIADRLLAAGEKVRVHGRSAGRLEALAARGAEPVVGDAASAGDLARAFAGAEAVYTLLPPTPQAADVPAEQDRFGEAIASAVRESGVRRVVMLSSVGADRPSGNGPIDGLYRQEQRLRAIPGIDLLILRPGYFMENLSANLPLIENQGINGGAIAGDVSFAAIATRDIAAAAAEALLAGDFEGGTVRELLGPRNVTMNELTRILGEAIGKPDLAYVQFPYDDFVAALEQAGLSSSMAQLYSEMARAFNEGRIAPAEGRNPRTTTPTPFETVAEELAAELAHA